MSSLQNYNGGNELENMYVPFRSKLMLLRWQQMATPVSSAPCAVATQTRYGGSQVASLSSSSHPTTEQLQTMEDVNTIYGRFYVSNRLYFADQAILESLLNNCDNILLVFVPFTEFVQTARWIVSKFDGTVFVPYIEFVPITTWVTFNS